MSEKLSDILEQDIQQGANKPKNKSFEESKFKPGQSGNPKGRPKGTKDRKNKAIREMAQDILGVDPSTGDQMTYKEYVKFMKLWALKSPVVARHFLEHANGKAPDKLLSEIRHTINDNRNPGKPDSDTE